MTDAQISLFEPTGKDAADRAMQYIRRADAAIRIAELHRVRQDVYMERIYRKAADGDTEMAEALCMLVQLEQLAEVG